MRHHVWVFSVLSLLLITTLDHAQAEQDKYNLSVITKDGLEFSVATDKGIYNEGEPVKISWKMTNISSESISYIRTSSCDDGFSFEIFDSTLHDLDGLLGENALLIPKDDPNLAKFSSKKFYGDILSLAKTDPAKQVIILIITHDADKLRKFLIEEFDPIRVGKGNAVGVIIAAKDIPEIAKSELVRDISDGEAGICTYAEIPSVLEPNQTIEDGFSWSQSVQSQDRSSNPLLVPSGHYSIQVQFNNTIANCITIGIMGNTPLSAANEIPCGLYTVPSWITKEQILDLYNQTRIRPELGGVSDEVFERVIAYLQIDGSGHETDVDNETRILSRENSEFASDLQNTPNSELDTRWYNPETLKFHPPLVMMKNGLKPADLVCNELLNKLYKPNSDIPVCVRPQTLEKLIERGWLTVPYRHLTK